MNCPKCHRELPDDAVLCCYCGKRFVPAKRTRPRRPNGTGHVYQRGKTWTARVVVGYKLSDDGTHKLPVWRTKGGFRSQRDAMNHLGILLAEGPKAQRKAPTLAEYWSSYEKSELLKLSVSKTVAYRGAWKKLSAIAHYPVDRITVTLLRETVSKAASTYYTARDCKVVLQHLFDLAGADGWVSRDLPSYIVLPDLHEKERTPFTEAEQAALWASYEAGNTDAAIPLIMIYTGMMPGEMMRLRPEMVDLEGRKIVGVGLKTKVRRDSPVYLPAPVVPLLAAAMEHPQDSGYLLYHSEKPFYLHYYAALETAGVRRLEPYSCRHTTATALAITENIAPQTVQRLMRWSTTRMLDRYAHPDDEVILSAADALKRPTE